MRITSFVAALALTTLPLAAGAQTVVIPPAEAMLVVGGDGLVERSPDVARVAVTIVTDDDVAARSAGKNTVLYNALKAKAAGLGVTADDVRTTYFNVQFVPHPAKGLPPEQRQPRYGYVTSRTLSISVAPIENAGKIVDAATAVGVTEIGDVTFDLRDRKSAYRASLAAAYADAKSNAEALASAGGVRLVRIRSVSSASYTPVRTAGEPVMLRAAAAEAPQPPTEIGPNGPISITAHVTVTYDIR